MTDRTEAAKGRPPIKVEQDEGDVRGDEGRGGVGRSGGCVKLEKEGKISVKKCNFEKAEDDDDDDGRERVLLLLLLLLIPK